MSKDHKTYFNCEIGLIEITGNVNGIKSLDFKDKSASPKPSSDKDLPECMKECVEQLSEYFKGGRIKFNLPLVLDGTEFQKNVWKQLIKIPFGKTNSYKEIAVRSGNAKASRAIGNANNKNKIAVIIPCHRVIGSNKKLTGYAGGLWRKEWLLNLEKAVSEKAYHLNKPE